MEFATAWKNKRYQGIMRDACRPFRSLSEHEIESCQMWALYDALRDFKREGAAQFTTYLYAVTQHRCHQVVLANERQTAVVVGYEEGKPIWGNLTYGAGRDSEVAAKWSLRRWRRSLVDRVDVRDALDALPPPDRLLVTLRLTLSIRDIAILFDISPTEVHRRLKAVLEVLRKVLRDYAK